MRPAAGSSPVVGAGAGAGSPPVSMVMIGVPTSTVVPASNLSSATVPANGLGSSTAAFAVSTSHSGWLTVTVSPTATSHCRISPSVSPSPTSGSLNSRSIAENPRSEGQGAVDGVEHAVEVGEVLLLELGRRVGRVVPADPQHRRLQRVEAGLGDPGGDLRAQPQGQRRLVDDDAATGAAHGGVDRLQVQRRDRAQVDDLQ